MVPGDPKSNLAIPGEALWKTCLNMSSRIKFGKRSAAPFYASGFAILEPSIDLGITKYDILSKACRVPPRTGALVVKHRPQINKWKASFHVNVDTRVFNLTNPNDTRKEVQKTIEDSGVFIGLLDNSPRLKGPHGKFKVTKLVEV